MNLTNLILWSIGIVIALAGVQNIDTIQLSILKAQAVLVHESRTKTWGSPKFFQNDYSRPARKAHEKN